MTGYVGWWCNIEREAGKQKQKQKFSKPNQREAAKISFLKKYYPDVHSTPDGTNRLREERTVQENNATPSSFSNAFTDKRACGAKLFYFLQNEKQMVHTVQNLFHLKRK